MIKKRILPRDTLEQCIAEYKRVRASNFVTVKELKPKQLTNALKYIAPDVKAEDVVGVMDTTLFSSGKDGFLVTASHLYGKSFRGTSVPMGRIIRLHKEESYLEFTYDDDSTEKLFVSIYETDLFNFLSKVIDAFDAIYLAEEAAAEEAIEDLQQHLASVEAAQPEPKLEIEKHTEAELDDKALDDLPLGELVPTPGSDVEMDGQPGSHEAAETAFKEGTAAFLKKDYAAAKEAFRKAAALGHELAAQFLSQLEAMGK